MSNLPQLYRSYLVGGEASVGISYDAFSRARTSHPGSRFDSQLTYQIDTDLWDSSTTGVGSSITHSSTERWAVLTAGAVNPASAKLQSHYAPPYTPGRGHLAFVTFLFGSTPGAGASRRAGLYADNLDVGIYLEQTASAVNLVLKGGTTAGTQTVAQASWNVDTMDGFGASGKTLDLTKVQILVISFQALYVGMVTIAFDIDGDIVPVHTFKHSNLIAYPYMQLASLPVHYSARTTSAAVTMYAICASVVSEGGENLPDISGRTFGVGNGTVSIGVTTRRAVLTIRARSQINSINSFTTIIPVSAAVMARTNDCYVEIVRNTTLGGIPSYTSVNSALSAVEYDIVGTTATGGQTIDAFYLGASATVRGSSEQSLAGKAVLAYSHLLGVADTLSVVVTARTGTCDVHTALKWKEIR